MRISGLDNSSGRIRGLLLRGRVQLSAERAHERDQPRHRPDPGPPDEPPEVPEAVLRPDETHPDIGALLLRRVQRGAEEVQEDGGEELRLPLIRDARG